ncbi:MAG TPA: hypothetical protein VN851_27905 [Thermoanaerobaculia bacterium]|nr:hypothetical protein [Thermoanaerobaculia bacterium]
MLIIHGTYHWKPKRIAFRNDYCRKCEAERLSVLVRTIDVLHVFWIPILPLGVWSRWFCRTCGGRPHEVTRTRRGFKIAGAVILALMSAVTWVPMPDAKDDMAMIWALRIGLPLATALAIRSAVRHRPEPDFKRRLAEVRPFEGWQCPLCGGQLMNLPKWHCLNCGAEHRPLRVRRDT